MKFSFYKQLNTMDCGPTCLKMVAKYYGKSIPIDFLRRQMGFNKTGVTLLGISTTAEYFGFRTRGVQLTESQISEIPLPAILHWDQNHFVVLISNKRNSVRIANPAARIMDYSKDDFLSHWLSSKTNDGSKAGIALLLEPTPKFNEQEDKKEQKLSWKLIVRYLYNSKGKIGQVCVALLVSSLLQLVFPFLTQSIVDTGINTQNLQYVVIVLMAQLMLTFSQTVIDFIRSRILLRLSNLLNIQILSDFWIKLGRLPLSYYDTHHTGDTLQRIGDHRTIQSFLTGTALSTVFSTVNFVVYSIVLLMYSVELFFVFLIGSIVYFSWVQLFLRIRRKINYQTFHISSKENNATLQMIQGMQEIRLNNAERQKRWEWENIQATIFRLGFKSLNYSQWQSAGATLINQVQNIAISFIVAKLVIDGKLTLGTMLAVQYIIGQMSGPISQWVGFVQSAQDAKISMERLNEVHSLSDEESPERSYTSMLPTDKSISIEKLSFSYPGAGNENVLEQINLYIPSGKTTAIVGISGSGKTSLLKLLLKIYEQYNGDIFIGGNHSLSQEGNFDKQDESNGLRFDHINHSYWRSICGTVMQDGYIFNDTIARNISVGQENIDMERLTYSCRTANIYSFIESLPNGFYTKLGSEGTGLSQGQKQRLLIARAIYKDPQYLFFDEATNSLDANNEKEIVENLERFFKGRTVVIVAHRLSTVKNADKIVVLHKGHIVEEGTHDYLISIKGYYYELVKNQLELGN
ncbi:peptidase domain-containing ABC transporter [Rhizosphaericola mali]|uniref:Peptidase domain-containing ABC transporter n=1 Tax=Rhizosphaericola mali TaxID=2545455 RepID=A0A5P2FX16_9BACT|nr:peptidase domain-containing ABC transporter [Rhizosphaericola mali]QES88064.1 peptidase domain-containing ABC transporter [Rhizosphaericola mali]QES88784.1 peptidase domain-containing ABC transporter [Rhizosphaericola mali]